MSVIGLDRHAFLYGRRLPWLGGLSWNGLRSGGLWTLCSVSVGRNSLHRLLWQGGFSMLMFHSLTVRSWYSRRLKPAGARHRPCSTLRELEFVAVLCDVTRRPTASAGHGAEGPVVARSQSQHASSKIQSRLMRLIHEVGPGDETLSRLSEELSRAVFEV